MSTQSSLHELDVFPWNDNFETGQPKIDEQHKMLIELLNKLASTLTLDQPIGVNQAFQELIQYANYHFKFEEAIWSEYFNDDSWFISHQTKHASFLPEILELQINGAKKPQKQIIEEIIQYLINWLAHHIIDDDSLRP